MFHASDLPAYHSGTVSTTNTAVLKRDYPQGPDTTSCSTASGVSRSIHVIFVSVFNTAPRHESIGGMEIYIHTFLTSTFHGGKLVVSGPSLKLLKL
jgi:hypothetical protein